MSSTAIHPEIRDIFEQLGVAAPEPGAGLKVQDPSNGNLLAELSLCERAEADAAVARSVKAFEALRVVPGPKRGELVRQMGDLLRARKEPLARLVTAVAPSVKTTPRCDSQSLACRAWTATSGVILKTRV